LDKLIRFANCYSRANFLSYDVPTPKVQRKVNLIFDGAAELRRLRAPPRHQPGAFDAFFFKEAKLPPFERYREPDPFPIPRALKPHLGRMANYMID